MFIKPLFFLTLLTVVLTSCSNVPPSPGPIPPIEEKNINEGKMFSNYFLPFEMGDPCILRGDDGYFYIFSTQAFDEWRKDGTSFLSYIPIVRSLDMINYEYVGDVFKEKPYHNGYACNGIWAPDVTYVDGTYYLYYSYGLTGVMLNKSGVGVCSSKSLAGPWTDHGLLFEGTQIEYGHAIDPCFVRDGDRNYLLFGSFAASAAYPGYAGIYYVELNSDCISVKQTGKPKELFFNNWQIEGVYVRKIHDTWYMFGSAGSCCNGKNSTYHVVCFKSKSLFGEWEDCSGIYDQSKGKGGPEGKSLVIKCKDSEGKTIGNVAGPGHNAIFRDDNDNYYILYHGTGLKEEDSTKRILFYDKLTFDEKGFPSVKDCISSYGIYSFDAPYLKPETYKQNFKNLIFK